MLSASINIAKTVCKRRGLFKHSIGYYSLKYRFWGKEHHYPSPERSPTPVCLAGPQEKHAQQEIWWPCFGSESSRDLNKMWKINLEKSFKFLNGLQQIKTLTSSYCGNDLLLLATLVLNNWWVISVPVCFCNMKGGLLRPWIMWQH